ncbi:MAG TPA: DegV family protein [Anaerolinea sp.]|nr:DegV family protein [Anaerolinea sp.]
MKIVSDRGMDLAPEQLAGLDLTFAPLTINIDGKSLLSGVDISPDEFYQLLEDTGSFPTTSQPSAGDFAALYRKLAVEDPEILSIHISSGLSGTMNAAVQGAAMVPEAHVTFVDSKTLSVPLGWQVEAAARALQAGWSLEQITTYLKEIRSKSDGFFTLGDLKYLIHGGRISHLRGLLGTLLQIKPIITVDEVSGKYVDVAKDRTLKNAIRTLAQVVARKYGNQGKVRVQLLHGRNLEGLEMLRDEFTRLMDCWFEPPTPIAPVLGAHTGPSMVGLAVGLLDVFAPVLPAPVEQIGYTYA